MGIERERKFLVANDTWRADATGHSLIQQGYLAIGPSAEVRIRIADGTHAWITVKSRQRGEVRMEFEYQVPEEDAKDMLELCEHPPLRKLRFSIVHEGASWEVDEFLNSNLAGLTLAEVEISGAETLRLPPWVGEEVTRDPAFRNADIAART